MRRPDRADAAAAALLLAFAVAVTWPAALHPAATVAAPIGYDVSSSIAKFAAIAREPTTPFTGGHLTSIGWPEGALTTPGLDAASALYAGPMWIGSAAIGSVAAHNLLSILGIVLTGLVTYGFLRSITGDPRAALVAAAAFATFPHLVLTVRAAPAYSHMWLYVLPLWAATALLSAPSRRRALFAGAAALPAMFWTPYFTLHVLVVMLALGGVAGAVLAARQGLRTAASLVGVMAAPVLAGLAAYVAVGAATSFADAPDRPAEDAFQQAAHPLMYLLPGNISWLWGQGPNDALAAVVPRAAGTNLYLGVTVLVLAVAGAAWTLRSVRGALLRDEHLTAPVAAGALALGVALLTFVWSLPPRIGLLGLEVPLPAELTFSLVPGLRAGQRFVMPLMCAVAVLAGLGAALLLRRIPRRAGAVVAAALVLAVVVDLSVRPDGRTTRIPDSPALAALRDAPAGPAVHYQRTDDGTTLLIGAIARPCVLQTLHDQPLVNGCNLPLPPATLARFGTLDAPGDCATIAALRALGVRYVIADAGVAAFAGCPGPELLARDAVVTVLRLPA